MLSQSHQFVGILGSFLFCYLDPVILSLALLCQMIGTNQRSVLFLFFLLSSTITCPTMATSCSSSLLVLNPTGSPVFRVHRYSLLCLVLSQVHQLLWSLAILCLSQWRPYVAYCQSAYLCCIYSSLSTFKLPQSLRLGLLCIRSFAYRCHPPLAGSRLSQVLESSSSWRSLWHSLSSHWCRIDLNAHHGVATCNPGLIAFQLMYSPDECNLVVLGVASTGNF